MDALPSSVEAYLQEAGFSGTELIVLHKLLAENALTLRELASKTGKSTGVLDQAVKKLIKKGIVSRESINGTPKYVMQSLNAVVAWMQEDMAAKQDMLQRKHENFESFVRSLTVTNTVDRPEMEYFEGIEGMKKAYNEIIRRGNDLVQYGPTLYLAEEDPLRDFRVQYFRERRGNGIFSRVITHDTVLGRRFRSRDPFEYRRTILVDPELYPFSFEKIIAGDTVACFELHDNRACFIRYPKLADDERVFFERLWNKKIATQKVEVPEDDMRPVPPKPIINVPMTTRTFSQFREFMLSRKSMATFGIFALLSAAVTYGLYLNNVRLNTQRIQERVKSIAATGALQFEAEDLEELRTFQDIEKPEYAKVIYQLNLIRNQNEGVRFTYLMRPTLDPTVLKFIADADSIDPSQKIDLNDDNIVDFRDALSYPGEAYDTTGNEPVPVIEARSMPVGFGPTTDQWGVLISGWAPIKDAEGNTVAILGVDVDAEHVGEITSGTFTSALYFLGFFILFTLIRLAAFNRSIFQEISEMYKARKFNLVIVSGLIIASACSLYVYDMHKNSAIERTREKILAIATTGALQFSVDDINELRVLSDVHKPAYQRVVSTLHEIREHNQNIRYAYIIRPQKSSTIFEFIADVDAYGLDLMSENDINADGIINQSDDIGYPGLQYNVDYIDVFDQNFYVDPVVTEEPYTDKWGKVFTGYAPIKNKSGVTVGLLAIDVAADDIQTFSLSALIPLSIYGAILLMYVLFRAPGYKKSLLIPLWKFLKQKKVLYAAVFILMLFYWIVFGLHFYFQKREYEEVGRRLMAIAATAALQINAEDLEPLRKASDMKREEYQRVHQQLNHIRNQNPEITYIYIWRPTSVDGIWEFVVDADSNYYLPEFYDHTADRIILEDDENVWPGFAYDISGYSPQIYKEGLKNPVYESEYSVDQWGKFLTATAPIIDKQGRVSALLAVDFLVN